MTAYEICMVIVGISGLLVSFIGIVVKLILAYIDAKK